MALRGGVASRFLCEITASSTCTVEWSGVTRPTAAVRKDPNRMEIFKGYIVDRNKAVLLREVNAVGRDEAEAALSLSLTPDELALQQEDELAVIWNNVGNFTRIPKTRMKLDK